MYGVAGDEQCTVYVCGRADVWGLGWQLHVVVRWGLGTVQLSECLHSIHHSFFFRKGRGREKTKVGRNVERRPCLQFENFQILYSFFVSLIAQYSVYISITKLIIGSIILWLHLI